MSALFRIQILACVFLLTINAVAQTDHPKIIDHLMDEAKISRPRGTNQVDTIMLHFSSDASAHPKDPYNLDRVIGTYGNAASAHYLIDRQGNIYRLVKERRTAWHAGRGRLPWAPYRMNLNSTSIGIEMMNISTWEDMKIFIPKATYDQVAKQDIGYTDEQYKSLKLLLADIRSRWPLIPYDRHHIISHSDYAPGRRTDPGVLFDWTRIGLPAAMPKE
ncbi:MAG TPA: N-acetylmuramoyl-L-alanine amidase [Verrucomicrobiae bacterium]|nr:N-acetylmuramoyl-L-alanine amidase [Verrucomicrobiae bacterium]